jgi:hypothetical protein
MAKRNQYNKKNFDQLPELTTRDLQVKGRVRVTGSLLIESSDPEISLRRSNPGARWRKKILEGTIDLSDRSQESRETSGSANPVRYYSSSVSIPKYATLDAVGVYVNSSLSGTTFLKGVGLTASYGQDELRFDVKNPYYFYSASAYVSSSGQPRPLSASSNNEVYFPKMSALTGAATHRLPFITGITGSDTVSLVFEFSSSYQGEPGFGSSYVANLNSPTGSLTWALFYSRYHPPTS